MTKESLYGILPTEVFRFTGNSESEVVRKGWSSTGVDYSNGVATFNAATSKILTNIKSNGVFQNGFTFILRIKLSSIAASGRLLEKLTTAGSLRGFAMTLTDDGRIRAITRNGASVNLIDSAVGVISVNNEYEIALTGSTDSKANIYINGVLSGDADQTITLSYIDALISISIGNNIDSDTPFTGDINLVTMYSQTFSAEDVLAHYEKRLFTDDKTGVVASYDLSRVNNSGTTFYDTSGNGNTGTSANTPTFGSDEFGRLGKAMTFNGTDDLVNCGTGPYGVGDKTIIAIINPTSIGDSSSPRIADNIKLRFWVTSSSQGVLGFSSDGSTNIYSGDGSIDFNKKYFVVVTRTAAGLATFYINGYVSGTPNQDSGTPESGGNVVIGNRAVGARPFAGNISKINFLNRLVGPAEVLAMWTQLQNEGFLQ